MTTTILRNYWYVAATTAEVRKKPLGRTICGEPTVLFRRKDGSIAALTDRCPHRKYALSKGEVVNGEAQCGYHGLRFDGTGTCTIIPSQDMIPPQEFNARPYPVVERYALIFVWIGDPARADPSLLPDWSENTAPGWTAVHGYHYIKANYQLILDNLLDLTHLAFVHQSTLGAQGSALAIVKNPNKVEVTADMVKTRRDMLNDRPSPIFRATKAFGDHERIDRFQTSWFRLPGYIHIVLSGAAPVGSTMSRSITPSSTA